MIGLPPNFRKLRYHKSISRPPCFQFNGQRIVQILRRCVLSCSTAHWHSALHITLYEPLHVRRVELICLALLPRNVGKVPLLVVEISVTVVGREVDWSFLWKDLHRNYTTRRTPRIHKLHCAQPLNRPHLKAHSWQYFIDRGEILAIENNCVAYVRMTAGFAASTTEMAI